MYLLLKVYVVCEFHNAVAGILPPEIDDDHTITPLDIKP